MYAVWWFYGFVLVRVLPRLLGFGSRLHLALPAVTSMIQTPIFGLVWVGLGWVGLGWVGLVWFGLERIALVWFGLDKLVWFGVEWIDLN